MENGLIIHSDGGSRGNPGPGACAFTVEQNGKVITKGSKYLGKVTNNISEYSGVLLALTWLAKSSYLNNHNLQIAFYMDSELVAKQLNGLYKIKNADLLKLNIQIHDLITNNNLDIIFKNIPRGKNKLADFLVNKELDKNLSGKFM